MKAAALVVLLCAPIIWAQDLPSQSLTRSAWDLGLWTGGGANVPGGIEDVRMWNAGLRIGKILTGEHGSGFLRGNLEYAMDLIPAYVFFGGGNTQYAGGFSPFILKWNFTGGRRVAPYAEFGGGILISPDELPPGTSNVNFMPQVSVGLHIFTRKKQAVTLAAKYVHISNAGLAAPNPGMNAVQFTLGYHWFRHGLFH